jgi:hypothetical protein
MQRKPIHERKFLHLTERFAIPQMTRDLIIRTIDLKVMEILTPRRLGQELENIIQRRILDNITFRGSFQVGLYSVGINGSIGINWRIWVNWRVSLDFTRCISTYFGCYWHFGRSRSLYR